VDQVEKAVNELQKQMESPFDPSVDSALVPAKGFKVCVVGGAGGIGQPLALLMAQNPSVSELVIIDLNVAMVPADGVAADLSHIEGQCKVSSCTLTVNEDRAVDKAGHVLKDCDLVLVPAGVPRKPGQDRKDLINTNASIAHGTVEACAKHCPNAVVALIVNPVNSVVPAMCEMWKASGLNPKKIVGISTLDIVRANKFVQDITGKAADVPVIGGHAGATILPLFSQDAAAAAIPADQIAALDKRVQDAGTEVVKAKNGKGSATLSMAYAGARLGKAVLSGLAGVPATECAYVESSVVEGLPYFASKVTFGKDGVETVHPVGNLSAHEQTRLGEMKAALREEIDCGLEYAKNNAFGQKPAAPKDAPAAGGSLFKDVQVAPADAILTLASWFKDDKFEKKVNLGVGAYRTEEGKPWPLPSVLKAQMMVCEDPNEDKEYVPIDGKPEHKKPVQQLMFSEAEIAKGTIATIQAISGTGSLNIIGQFLAGCMKCKVIHVPKPTWGNHQAIFKRAGLECKDYTYYKTETRGFDFEGMIESMSAMKAGEAILLHAVAQNPTGVDPTAEQWKKIVETCKSKQLIVLLDNAYQGYASGNLATDGASIKLFEDAGMEFFVAQSFAKNFGLYGERIGYIHARCENKAAADAVLSQLKIFVRQAYSSPPRHGAAIVFKLLSSPELKAMWLAELKFMSDRILAMRDALRKAIEAKGTPGTWNHITDQIGMFSFTGLSTPQVERMVNECHIYMTKDGRISVAGLNPGNVSYVAESIDKVARG
jgi:NAD-dependent malate dehydrogenase